MWDHSSGDVEIVHVCIQPRITSAPGPCLPSSPPLKFPLPPSWPVHEVLSILGCSLGVRDMMGDALGIRDMPPQACQHPHLTFSWLGAVIKRRSLIGTECPHNTNHKCPLASLYMHLDFQTKSSYKTFSFDYGTQENTQEYKITFQITVFCPSIHFFTVSLHTWNFSTLFCNFNIRVHT